MGLPLSGQQNTVISWESSNTSIISDNGIVVLPSNDYVDVTLTATIEFNGTTDTKSFIVRVVSDNVTNFTVSFNTNGGTTYPNQTVQSGLTATNPGIPEKTGFNFVGWFYEDLTTPFVFTTPIESDITIFAIWSAKPSTYTFDASGSFASGIADGVIPSARIVTTNDGLATLTASFHKNDSSTITIFSNSVGETRLYGGSGNGGQLTFDISSGYIITSITVYTSTNNGYTINGGITITGAAIKTSFSTNVTSVVVKNVASANAQVRITSITITYAPN